MSSQIPRVRALSDTRVPEPAASTTPSTPRRSRKKRRVMQKSPLGDRLRVATKLKRTIKHVIVLAHGKRTAAIEHARVHVPRRAHRVPRIRRLWVQPHARARHAHADKHRVAIDDDGTTAGEAANEIDASRARSVDVDE
eukprot:CAMPEP_0179709682 /NCGR_PEP_ID=MMETSP0937-20121108/6020_1 /TAXON_ID=548131 ORGANISM="Ostreococcus mediterraneus, Strain clade-D-RCC2593" /NCGR_SAMPLE_ID=MMETSP0937 /ASSEMBLY_ACC=CAM_ASM_000575 /LENGTH=138 /DNA_ID=CAMNT_0021583057 /DNA_START=72 /DNA_END=486 /DNA_ORIENTATION=+